MNCYFPVLQNFFVQMKLFKAVTCWFSIFMTSWRLGTLFPFYRKKFCYISHLFLQQTVLLKDLILHFYKDVGIFMFKKLFLMGCFSISSLLFQVSFLTRAVSPRVLPRFFFNSCCWPFPVIILFLFTIMCSFPWSYQS